MLEKTNLVNLLTLKQTQEFVFQNIASKPNLANALYGGQVLAQALIAAYKTVPSFSIHSLHAYFLRPGRTEEPVNYKVECLRDGRSISSRRVVAFQNDKPIFHLSASFHVSEPGFSHQDTSIEGNGSRKIPLPNPATIGNQIPIETSNGTASDDIEVFGIEMAKQTSEEKSEPFSNFWFRVKPDLGNDMAVHHGALAYISDMRFITTALFPHPVGVFSKNLQVASIDHSIWFHQENYRVNDWMLYKMHSPWSGNSRGLVKGEIFSANGDLIATVSQEGLIRKRN